MTTYYTDGSCIVKTGRGGYAVVDEDCKIVAKMTLARTTSQRAELYAIYQAIFSATFHEVLPITIVTDSQYAINVLTRQKVAHKNRDLVEQMTGAWRIGVGKRERDEVILEWRPRNFCPQMKLADKIARQCAEGR